MTVNEEAISVFRSTCIWAVIAGAVTASRPILHGSMIDAGVAGAGLACFLIAVSAAHAWGKRSEMQRQQEREREYELTT